jgi:hypothetical protein
MSTSTDCPVCFEAIVTPYGLPCGHTICACCFSQLMEDICPTCRSAFSQKEKFEPNSMLEQLLMIGNPNYLELKKKKDVFVKINRFTSQYKDSIYLYNLRKKLIKYIHEKGNYSELEEFVLDNSDISRVELYYAIDHTPRIVPITLGDYTYIVDCENIDRFVRDKYELISSNHNAFYELIMAGIGIDDDDIIALAQLCNIKGKQKLSRLDSTEYTNWIIKFDTKQLVKRKEEDFWDDDETE